MVLFNFPKLSSWFSLGIYLPKREAMQRPIIINSSMHSEYAALKHEGIMFACLVVRNNIGYRSRGVKFESGFTLGCL